MITRLLIASLLVIMSACTHIPKATPKVDWTASGKLNIAATERTTVNFFWQQSDDRINATLSGPFGYGKTIISGNNRWLSISNSDTHVEGPAQDIMQQHLGWSTPVDGIQFWLQGKPNPHQSVTHQGKHTFAQAGWTITASRFKDGSDLPHRVIMSNPRVKMIFLIGEWQ